MNMVTVRINGVDYNLKGEENEEYLNKVVNYVDKKIKGLIENNEKLSTTSAAVFTAISAVDDYYKSKEVSSELMAKLAEKEQREKDFIKSIENLKLQIKELEERNNNLHKDLINSKNAEIIRAKDAEISNLNQQVEVLNESSKKYLKAKSDILIENKELKFQLQTSKYKIMELQNKFLENQIDLARAKSCLNPPYLRNGK